MSLYRFMIWFITSCAVVMTALCVTFHREEAIAALLGNIAAFICLCIVRILKKDFEEYEHGSRV